MVAAVLLLDRLEIQPKPLVSEVSVTVVMPEVTSGDVVNVPVLAPIVSTAVLPVAVVAPERLYVAVNVPVPREVEDAVNTAPAPEHCEVTEEAKTLIFGTGLTVTDVVAVQPPGNVYTILVVPAATPVTVPVIEPTVPTAVLLLLHTPPLVTSFNVTDEFWHTTSVPVMAAGVGLTVIG